VALTLADEDVGEPPRVVDPDQGCRFRPRCPYAQDRCALASPALAPVEPGHEVACFVAADAAHGASSSLVGG